MQVSGEIDLLAVDVTLAERAGRLAADRPIRGMDAVYLATALALAGTGPVGLLSFDARQRDVVRPEDDIALVPAEV